MQASRIRAVFSPWRINWLKIGWEPCAAGAVEWNMSKFPTLCIAVLMASLPLGAQTPNASIPPKRPRHAPHPATSSAELQVDNAVVFGKGGTQDLHCEIIYPKGATKPLGAVVVVHGGGWIKGSYLGSIAGPLARHGYFAMSIEYRLSDVAKWPAQIQDCECAVRYLRANAAKYHIDPDRIAAFGGSAGGHLVACLGTMANVPADEGDGGNPGVSSAVQAVVDWYGPTDFIRPGVDSSASRNLEEGLIGVPLSQNPALWKSASPLYHVAAGDPPMFMAHGLSDTLVPPASSIELDAALAKAGVPHQLLLVKNAGHDFGQVGADPIDPPFAEIERQSFAFLDRYIGPPQPPVPDKPKQAVTKARSSPGPA